MNKVIIPIVVAVVVGAGAGIGGFYAGQEDGYFNGYNDAQFACDNKSIDELKDQIKGIEEKKPYAYLSGKGGVRRLNEGSFFSPRYVNYFKGHISNDATMATFKEVTLHVQFFASSGEKVGEQDITVHEFVLPQGKAGFEEKLNVTGEIQDFKF